MGRGGGDGGLRGRPIERRAPQSRGDHRAGRRSAAFPWADVPSYIAAQLVGAFLGAVLVWLAYLPHWEATADPGRSWRCSAPGPRSARPVPNLITEVIGTAVLLFGILAIAANAQTLSKPGDVDLTFVFSRGLQPLLVGVLVLGIGALAGRPHRLRHQSRPRPRSAPRARPAADPRQGHSDWDYAWIPIVGPLIGGVARRRPLRVGRLLTGQTPVDPEFLPQDHWAQT